MTAKRATILEIGPGDDPLISDRSVPGSDWLPYDTQEGEYTCVQPLSWRGYYRIGDAIRQLPRVTVIDSMVEDIDMSVFAGRFAEVYARNVLCDPGVAAGPILNAASLLVECGGTISFLDIATPEYAPSRDELSRFMGDRACTMTQWLVASSPDVTADQWCGPVGRYARSARHGVFDGYADLKARFVQFTKQA